MVSIVLTLALLLASVKGLTTPMQSSNVKRTVTLLPNASDRVNTSQIQGTLQTQGLSVHAVRLSSTALDAKSSASTSPSNFSLLGEIAAAPVSIANGAVQLVYPAYPTDILISPTVSIVVGTPSTTPKPSATTRKLSLHPPKSEAALKRSISTSVPPPTVGIHTGLLFNSQTIIANSKSQSLPGQPLSPGSTVTRGLGTSSPVLNLQGTSVKTTVTNSPSRSFPGAEFTGIPALITSSQTVTSNGQNQHIVIDGQTFNPSSSTTLGSSTSTTDLVLHGSGTQARLIHDSSTSQSSYAIATPGGMITVSGTMVSIAPNNSDVVVGTSKEALSTNIKAGFSAGPNVTPVQTFKGSALGASNGLWSSLMGFFVGIAVLLWL